MQTKICPECGAEYFARIAECADCEVPLVAPEPQAPPMSRRGAEVPLVDAEPMVSVREGSRDWIEELRDELEGRGISCGISLAPGCKAGTCGEVYHLRVPASRGDEAGRAVEAYLAKVHPELEEAQKLAAEGKCPACGHPVDATARTCPDCGLVLFLEVPEEGS